MERVSLTFPELYNHVIQMYAQPSSLVFMQGSSTVVIPSEEGVHQGDPLGPVLFAMAIHPVLTKIQKSHSQVRVLAYLDDVSMLGGAKSVLAAFHDLKETFSTINLVIAEKSARYSLNRPRLLLKGLKKFLCLVMVHSSLVLRLVQCHSLRRLVPP